MSRSFGSTSLTGSPPIRMTPSVGSSRPAIIRSAVDLPQPDGPSRTRKLAVGDVEAEIGHRFDVAEALGDPIEVDVRHGPLSPARTLARSG